MTKRPAYYLINALTWYRLLAAPVLLVLLFTPLSFLFKWLLGLSLLTDAVDGMLARSWHVTSRKGALRDSSADDLTILAGLVGLVKYQPAYLLAHMLPAATLLTLYVFQVIFALSRYGRLSGFHTYTAKTAAVAQGGFLLLFFFKGNPGEVGFQLTFALTGLSLLEDIILVALLPKWRPDVKGLVWVVVQKLSGWRRARA